jgi:Tol biopolymer transport system component
VKRGITSSFTYDAVGNGVPVWSPGGERIVYNSARGGARDLYLKSADGGQEELLLKSSETKVPSDWSPDGKYILYYRGDERDGSWDIWALPVSGDHKPFPVVQSSFQETHAQFSPDGQWVVYASNETGIKEIYARPFRPDDPSAQLSSPRIQITNGGGSHPRWRRDGRELFFRNRESRIVALPVILGSKLQTGKPQVLFQVRGERPFEDILYDYDVTPDGQHFLYNLAVEVAVSPITVVVNWDAGLK